MRRLLIVDDHEPVRAVVRDVLERGGFVVAREAADAAGALAAVAVEAPDGRRIEACGARGFILESRLSAAAFAALVE